MEIKDLIDQGVNLAGIKQIFSVQEKQVLTDEVKKEAEKARRELSDEDLRKLLRKELLNAGRFNDTHRPSMRQGDMSRYFQK